MDVLRAFLLGVIEGITEWLPVSSTGHLILCSEILSFSYDDPAYREAFRELFDVVIQLGAILAVVMRLSARLSPFSGGKTRAQRREVYALYRKLVLSGLPAAVVGILGDKILLALTGRDLDTLLFRPSVVAAMLILYGVLFLLAERLLQTRTATTHTAPDAPRALFIGCCQALAVVPGTSRSGATILGGLFVGLSRTEAAAYSFALAIPTMAGAAFLKIMDFVSFLSENGRAVSASDIVLLLVGTGTAFFVSRLSVDFLMRFVEKHSFVPFAVYRILLGGVVLLLIKTGFFS